MCRRVLPMTEKLNVLHLQILIIPQKIIKRNVWKHIDISAKLLLDKQVTIQRQRL
jgi:hypothetical protein